MLRRCTNVYLICCLAGIMSVLGCGENPNTAPTESEGNQEERYLPGDGHAFQIEANKAFEHALTIFDREGISLDQSSNSVPQGLRYTVDDRVSEVVSIREEEISRTEKRILISGGNIQEPGKYSVRLWGVDMENNPLTGATFFLELPVTALPPNAAGVIDTNPNGQVFPDEGSTGLVTRLSVSCYDPDKVQEIRADYGGNIYVRTADPAVERLQLDVDTTFTQATQMSRQISCTDVRGSTTVLNAAPFSVVGDITVSFTSRLYPEGTSNPDAEIILSSDDATFIFSAANNFELRIPPGFYRMTAKGNRAQLSGMYFTQLANRYPHSQALWRSGSVFHVWDEQEIPARIELNSDYSNELLSLAMPGMTDQDVSDWLRPYSRNGKLLWFNARNLVRVVVSTGSSALGCDVPTAQELTSFASQYDDFFSGIPGGTFFEYIEADEQEFEQYISDPATLEGVPNTIIRCFTGDQATQEEYLASVNGFDGYGSWVWKGNSSPLNDPDWIVAYRVLIYFLGPPPYQSNAKTSLNGIGQDLLWN